MKTILLTGATGYIGSHGAVALLEKGYNVIIVDNLSNSNEETIDNINEIIGQTQDTVPTEEKNVGVNLGVNPSWLKFYQTDLRNKQELEQIFKENKIDSVIHFAGAKAVGESCERPFYYYENNIVGSLNLFELMDKYGVKNIIFSSSATVYKPDEKAPFIEQTSTGNTTNPYGTTKFIIENILRDLSNHKGFNVVNLRYFNPVGAHQSGLIGEDPNDIPNNLLPFIMKVANGELEELKVFGDDYPTTDGTGERDYIHVLDLIDGHIKALEYIDNSPLLGKRGVRGELGNRLYQEINLGTGKATSVLEMIDYAKKATGKDIKYKIVDRRAGDIATSYCNPQKAKELLNWEAKYSVEEAVKDSWNFIQNKKTSD